MSQLGAANIALYGWCRSSCSGRLRISLALKEIAYNQVSVDLTKGKHLEGEYSSINPSRAVPTLEIQAPGGLIKITQSVSALEYLEEAFPESKPLLPSANDTAGRAQVRTLVNIIACDVQPPTNLRILKAVKELGEEQAKWAQEYMSRGMEAYEAIASKTAGKYSYGDQITLADVCLVPAVWNLERWEVDMAPFPTVRRVYEELKQHPAIRSAHWACQPDTPEGVRQNV